ncbi:MAG: SDR family oxidoreductase [Lysobacterales bacterium]|nr:SDR family oxidoreductase [Xanthomonadales bacterium]MCB1611198.1 SDR family oxidoreductase [Xanthomonadales bacterium]MCP5475825.1 SDR family oxidoreductase [Rhodanobacteraceae bacterium]
MNLPLADKYALITGSSKGVGLAAARLFAAQGARVVMHANTAVDTARSEAAAIGAQVLGVVAADLSQPGAGTRLFEQADALAGGRLGIVVNNAGIYLANELAADEAQWQHAWASVLQVNLLALADVSRAAVRAFVGRGGGSLINIASRAGYRGDDGDHTAYAASKGAVLALTKTLARAYGKDGVLAYALAPGWIDTRMAPQNAAGLAAAKSEIPIGRMASPEEVAAMCAFLASGACASATGACIDINGASYVR